MVTPTSRAPADVLLPTWHLAPPPGRRLIHVNSTAVGGGVAEMLRGLVRAQASAGTSVGWAVVAGSAEFFAITKYLHHLLHGRADPAALGDRLEHTYRSVLAPQAEWLAGEVGAGDVVVLHDPQTLGMAPSLAATGAKLVWHCHIGTTSTAAAATRGPAAVWRLFARDLSAVDAVVTTLPEFAPPTVPVTSRWVSAPAIDPDSPKNRSMAPREIAELLASIGLTDGTRGCSHAAIVQDSPIPYGSRMVLQVSRWDPLKDMVGVLLCTPELPPDVHVVLAGTNPGEIPDDPEGQAVLDEVRAEVAKLSVRDRQRVHLVLTSLRDVDYNALIVNALQRRADVVLQKSLEEGFGLTVTEAMLKRRAVVAANVGGLRHQVSPGRTGLLVDPLDRPAVVTAVRTLLDDPPLRRRLGAQAATEVRNRYTVTRLARDYAWFAAPGRARQLSSG